MRSNDQTPVSTEALQNYIGRLTVLWNDIHFCIFLLFWKLMDKDIEKSEAIFFLLRSDRAQRDLTKSLVKATLERHPDVQNRTCKAIEAINDVSGRRNDFIHAMWINDHPNVVKVWTSSSPRLSEKDIKQEAISLERDCLEANLTIVRLIDEVDKTLHPKQPTNRLLSTLAKDYTQTD